MLQALTGFVVVGVAILMGYILGRTGTLGPHARFVLSRLTFYLLSPFLLFSVLSSADVHTLFSAQLPVSAIAAVSMILVQALFSRLLWRRSAGETVIAALSAGHVNANNIGIPLSLYLLGSAAYPAPVILMQLLLFTPISLGILDAVRTGSRSIRRILWRVLLNPIIAASVLGALVATLGWQLPEIVMAPIELVAHACVPVLLISFGMSLYGQRVLAAGGHRSEVIGASVLKLVIMPVLAWAVATFAFGMTGHDVLVVVVLAALPTAQNVFNYAQQYEVGEPVARDVVFLTTLGCVPVLLAATFLLG